MNRAARAIANRIEPPGVLVNFASGRRGTCVFLWSAALVLASLGSARAQLQTGASGVPTVSTVRENEFRSRSADYQVDRPPQAVAQHTEDNSSAAPGGLLSAFGQTFNDYFRNGPLQLRANLAAGWEYTDEKTLERIHPDGSHSSPFAAPAFGLFYNLELGPATISARYSLGYVYYIDQNYLAVNHNGGILSQSAALDVGLSFNRATVRSSTSGAYGTGNDIESGTLRDRLYISEALDASYLLTDFSQLGANTTFTYFSYSGGDTVDTDESTITGTLFGDYIITGKSRLRLEVGAGDEHQSAGNTSNSDRSYYQALLRINYVPTGKLSFDGGLGWGVQEDSAVVNRQNGNHPIYTISIGYTPTEKTSARVHFGYEGADLSPDFSLQAQWQPRPNTTVGLSVYQNNNFSTFVIGQNLTTRGILGTIQQKLFEKVELDLASGAEQTRGYSGASGRADFSDPYYFASVSLLWQFNSALALQTYYRGFTGEAGQTITNQAWQSRASISLRLTF